MIIVHFKPKFFVALLKSSYIIVPTSIYHRSFLLPIQRETLLVLKKFPLVYLDSTPIPKLGFLLYTVIRVMMHKPKFLKNPNFYQL